LSIFKVFLLVNLKYAGFEAFNLSLF